MAVTDKRLARLVLRLPDGWRPVMAAMSFIGEPTVVATVAFFGYISAALQDRPVVMTAIFYSAIGFCMNIILKMLIHRPRPGNLDIEVLGIRSYSFPSGHAFGSVIFYGLFAIFDIRYLTAPWNYLIGGLLIAAIFLIGVSRVYLKRHYPTDVLAGWLLGGISLIAVYILAF
jgi:undecaprenyl-diphosphatase